MKIRDIILFDKKYKALDEDVIVALLNEDGDVYSVDAITRTTEWPDVEKHQIPNCNDIVSIDKAKIDKGLYAGTFEIRKLSTDKGVVKSASKSHTYVLIDGFIFTVRTCDVTDISHTFPDGLRNLIRSGFQINIPEYLNNPEVKDGNIEYTPAGKDSSIRQAKKARRVISDMLLYDNCNSFLIETLFTYVTDHNNIPIEILEGENIYDVFVPDNIVNSGNLARSCMMDKPADFFQIYAENAKCVIMKDEKGKIMIRAMLWDDCIYDSTTDEKLDIKLIDRVYTANDNLLTIFLMWAKSNGYHTLQNQTYSEVRYVGPETSLAKEMPIYVKLKRNVSEYKNTPYIDTFHIGLGDRLYNDLITTAHRTYGKIDMIRFSEGDC